MERRPNFQKIVWFNDQYKRDLLNLDPSYQRRSVWNQPYRDYFIDTVLLEYPSPAIFLYEDIHADGTTIYNVVDGKQRLTTVFDFIANKFPVSDEAKKTELRGKYFDSFDDETKFVFGVISYLLSTFRQQMKTS